MQLRACSCRHLHVAQQARQGLPGERGGPAVEALQAALDRVQEARQPLPVAGRDDLAHLLRARSTHSISAEPMVPHRLLSANDTPHRTRVRAQ